MQAADVYVYVPKQQIGVTSPSGAVFVLRGGILSGMATIDFAETVRRRLAEKGQSKYRAAVASGLPQDAIRYVLNGHVPRLNRVEQICRAIGLELYIGPPRDVQVEADGAQPSRPLTRFDPSVQLPVRVLLPPAPDVYLMKSEEADQTKPAPVDSGRPAGVLRVAARPLDGPDRHRAGRLLPRLSVREARARSADLAPGPEGARRAAMADQADGGHLRGGRLAAAQAERPPGPRPRAVGAKGRRRPQRHPGGCTAVGWFRRTRFTGFPTGTLAGSPVCGRRCSTSSRSSKPR